MTEELVKRNNTVIICSPDPACKKESLALIVSSKFAVTKCHSKSEIVRFFNSTVSYFFLFPTLLREARQSNLIIAHHHNHHLATATSFSLSKILNVPCCIFVHDLLTYNSQAKWYHKVLDKLCFTINSFFLKRATLFVQSKGVVESYNLRNAIILPNSISIMSFQEPTNQDELKKRLILPDTFTLVFLGTVTQDRGMSLLVKAIELLANRGYQITVLFIGRAPDMFNLISLADKLGVKNSLKFLGPVPHQTVPSYLRLADVAIGPLAVPPTIDTVPVKVLEYMASELPTIAIRHSVPSELIIHGSTGWLLNRSDETELMNAILFFILHPEQRNQMGKNARKHVIANYESKQVMNRFCKITNSIIRKNH